ncbi:MAG: dTDP-4-dehydrorhamnose 3,5-epimerase [Endomicrobiales bacterium]|nr:dTDP-4-dehydrorhamnose 3,5-epimerase [Endomicrobiales bacterium]
MKIKKTKLPGVLIVEPRTFKDRRGSFVKTFNDAVYRKHGIKTAFKETFYSVNKKNVVRGMHFHTTPFEHEKLVYVPKGEIIDVVLDLRRKLPTYGKYLSIKISEQNKKAVFVPKGCAHGFLSLKDGTIVVYEQTSEYSKVHDSGIRWDSFGMKWGIKRPVMSEKDSHLQAFRRFKSPF